MMPPEERRYYGGTPTKFRRLPEMVPLEEPTVREIPLELLPLAEYLSAPIPQVTPPRTGATWNLLKKLFPETVTTPGAENIVRQINEQPDLFVTRLRSRGTAPEREQLLISLGATPENIALMLGEGQPQTTTTRIVTAPVEFLQWLRLRQSESEQITILKDLGASDDDIPEILGVARITPVKRDIQSLLNRLYQDIPDLDLSMFETIAQGSPEVVVEDLLRKGKSEDSVALLKTLGMSDADIDEFFGQELPRVAPTAAPIIPEPDIYKGLLAGVQAGVERMFAPPTEKPITPRITDISTFMSDYYKTKGWAPVHRGIATAAEIAEDDRRITEARKAYQSQTGKSLLDIGRETVRGDLEKARDVGRAILPLPRQIAVSVLQAAQGQGGASVVNKDWADKFIESAHKDFTKFVAEMAEKYGEEAHLPIKMTDIASISGNIAYSLTSMGAGLAVGAPIALIPVPGARVAAWLTGSAASGAAAYSMTTYQIMQQYLEAKNEESIARTGRGITAAEEKRLKVEFEAKAREYGLWEAVPEAISNLAFGTILTAPLTKVAGGSIAAKIILKLFGIYGEELLTETITQKGQSDIEVEAGLRQGNISWGEAFKEIAPQTFLLTTVLAGLGQVGVSSYNRIRQSLVGEVGGDSPLVKTFDKEIEGVISQTREAVVSERGALQIPPTEPGKVTPVPEVEIKQIVADLNLIREEKIWNDTMQTKGSSIVNLQTGRKATIIEPAKRLSSSNYADRAMQIRWEDGSEWVVDASDFAPSVLQKQIAEITHGKPIPPFPEAEAIPKAEAVVAPEKVTPAPEVTKYHPDYVEYLRGLKGKTQADFVVKREVGAAGDIFRVYDKADLVHSILGMPTQRRAVEYLKGEIEKANALEQAEAAPKAEAVTPEEAVMPRPVAGMPEAGVQRDIFGNLIPFAPAGRGVVTQISMEEQLKLQQAREAARPAPTQPEYEARAQIEGLQNYLDTEPASKYIGLIQRTGAYKGEVKTLTLKQFRDLTGDMPSQSSLTPDKKHVYWEYALDDKATELGYKSGDEFKAKIEEMRGVKDRITALKRQMVTGLEEEEVEAEMAKPPAPPGEQPPAPPRRPEGLPSMPDEWPAPDLESDRIIGQARRQVELDQPKGLIKLLLRIPGLRAMPEFFAPKFKMMKVNPSILTAMISKGAAEADVATWAFSSRMPVFKELVGAFSKDALRGKTKLDISFKGTEEQAKSPLVGTLLDIVQRTYLYDVTATQKKMIENLGGRNDGLLDWVVLLYEAEIGTFKPEGGTYLPNVDISEDIVEYLGSEVRAIISGRGKTRIWQSAADRLAHDTAFQPELDVQKLIEGMDVFKARAAGAMVYRKALGGLTRLEAMEKTHPNLYKEMTALRSRLQSLRGSLARLEMRLEEAVDKFIASPVEDIDLDELHDSLDVQLLRGVRKGMNIEQVQQAIDSVRSEIKELRPAWNAANLKPYVFVQEGIYRYFPMEEASLIRESLRASSGALDPVLRFGENWRQTSFSSDGSPIGIQGQVGFLADPIGSIEAAYGGLRSGIQEHKWRNAFSIDALAERIAEDPVRWSRFASLSGRTISATPSEYGVGFLKVIPGLSKANQNVYTLVTIHSYNFWNRKVNELMKHGIPELDAEIIANDLANQVYPLFNPARAGLSEARAKLLRAFPTSYSFIMQVAKLNANAATGIAKLLTFQKLTPQESISLKTMVTMWTSILITSATSAALTAIHRKKEPEEIWQAIKDAVNPDPYNGKFANLIIPVGSRDIRIPLGGPYRAFARALYPGDVKGVPFPVPGAGLWRFFANRINPALKTQIDLIRNKDYWGREILKGNVPEQILRAIEYELENILPLTAGVIPEAIRRKREIDEIINEAIGQFMGVNPVILDNTYLFKEVRKLGTLKDEPPPEFSIERPYYTTKDLWTNTLRLIKDIATDQIGRHNFPKITQAIAEARDTEETLSLIGNRKLRDINADPAKGDTFIQFYEQWQDRLGIKGESKLKEFDKKYPDARFGNMTLTEYRALEKYHSLTPREQAQYLKEHPELSLNPYVEWLRFHPKENALLAVFGQADILSPGAYKEAQRLIKEWDIPDDGLPPFTLPPEGSVSNFFKYKDMDNKNSWEAQLMLAKDSDLLKFLGRQPIDTPIASLELKVKNRALFDKLDGFSDKDSSNYIADEKKRAEAIKKFRADNLGFVDDIRRIEAIEKGSAEVPTPDTTIKAHLAYGKLIDQEGVGSSSADVMLYRVDNPDYDKWRTDTAIWGDQALKPVDQSKIPIWRIDVKYRKEDAEYEAIKNPSLREQARLRAEYMTSHPEYRKDNRRREAYGASNSITGERFPSFLVEPYVDYGELPIKGFRRERMLIQPENLVFAQAMHRVMGIDLPDPLKVPPVEYDDLYDRFKNQFDEWENLGNHESPHYIEDPERRQRQRVKMQFERGTRAFSRMSFQLYTGNEFWVADRKRQGYLSGVRTEQMDDYVAYSRIITEGKPVNWEDATQQEKWYEDDWFLMEHPDFYKNVYLGIFVNERRDFRNVPSRGVFEEYLAYVRLPPGAERRNFRYYHTDLDEWGQIALDWAPLPERGKAPISSTDALRKALRDLMESIGKIPQVTPIPSRR